MSDNSIDRVKQFNADRLAKRRRYPPTFGVAAAIFVILSASRGASAERIIVVIISGMMVGIIVPLIPLLIIRILIFPVLAIVGGAAAIGYRGTSFTFFVWICVLGLGSSITGLVADTRAVRRTPDVALAGERDVQIWEMKKSGADVVMVLVVSYPRDDICPKWLKDGKERSGVVEVDGGKFHDEVRLADYDPVEMYLPPGSLVTLTIHGSFDGQVYDHVSRYTVTGDDGDLTTVKVGPGFKAVLQGRRRRYSGYEFGATIMGAKPVEDTSNSTES